MTRQGLSYRSIRGLCPALSFPFHFTIHSLTIIKTTFHYVSPHFYFLKSGIHNEYQVEVLNGWAWTARGFPKPMEFQLNIFNGIGGLHLEIWHLLWHVCASSFFLRFHNLPASPMISSCLLQTPKALFGSDLLFALKFISSISSF